LLIRMGLVVANPCDAIERPRTIQSVARGYGADEVRRLLAVVPDTVAGRRDRAIGLRSVTEPMPDDGERAGEGTAAGVPTLLSND
jgi:site-specific recombinase XerC